MGQAPRGDPILLFLLACPPPDVADSGIACTEMAVSSVTLTVQDADGDPVEGAAVTYSVDGGAAAACESFDGLTFVCGYEQVGTFDVAVSAPGYVDQALSLVVEPDASGCHVESVVETVVLDGVDCTEEARPSVIVHLWSMIDTPIENPQVLWGYQNADMAPQPCFGEGLDWTCGEEVAGDLEIFASADFYQTAYVPLTVEMTADGCHVVTQEIDVELIPAQ